MMVQKKLRTALLKLQAYAALYFSVLYRTVIQFWLIPNPPTGANVLTGGFAFLLLYSARMQLSLPVDSASMYTILFASFFIILIICGVLVVFDPRLRKPGAPLQVSAMAKLVSVICVGIILGCALVVLDTVFPWIDPLFGLANALGLSASSATFFAAGVAALFAFIVILTNSIIRAGGVRAFFSDLRNDVWSGIILIMLIIGVDLLLK
jgi:hypothetical protein